MSLIVLAPMEGLADELMRATLTRVGQYDWCVCQFIRVTDSVLPARTFHRICPELLHGSRTAAGTPVRVQLMGSDPARLADNAVRLVGLAPAGVDLNFGCPAPLVNRHGGGAALLDEPERLARIAQAVRAAVPPGLPYTAKMRLGVKDAGRAIECAQALASGGIDALIVHGRTKVEGYRPPAHYHWIAQVREAVAVPVIANGEIWTPADAECCRQESGCADLMLGRGAIADPFLVRQLRGGAPGDWDAEMLPLLAEYWGGVLGRVLPIHAPGRLKQWLALLCRTWPEAEELRRRIRPLESIGEVEAALRAAGVPLLRRAA